MKRIFLSLGLSTSILMADNSIGLDTIVGGVIGVAIGNQIGGGSGRDVARIVGGITGVGIANGLRENKPRYIDTNYSNNIYYSEYRSPNVYYYENINYNRPIYHPMKPMKYHNHYNNNVIIIQDDKIRYRDGYRQGYEEGYRKGVRLRHR